MRARGTEAPSQIKGLCGDYAFGVVAQAPPLAGRIDAKIAASVFCLVEPGSERKELLLLTRPLFVL